MGGFAAVVRVVLAVVVSAVGMAVVALLQATPASASEADGDLRTKCVQQAPYYFHGESLADGTFNQTEPDRDLPSFQHFSRLPNTSLFGHARWVSGFTGRLCGEIEATLYIAKVLPGDVGLWVYGSDSLIGLSGYVPLASTGGLPVEHVFRVAPSRAAVADTLNFVIDRNGIQDATFYYDHQDYAAGFRGAYS